MANKRIVLSEARKQKLYNDVTEIVMLYRIKVAKGFQTTTSKELDEILYKLQIGVGSAAIQSIEQPLK